MLMPEVTVIMPCLNAAPYLAEAIESVLLQDASWELLVVDDGSTDGSANIALEYASCYRHIRLLQHPGGVNRGASASRNLALARARGSFVAFLDADDVWLPSMLSTQCRILREHPDVAMAYANAERWFPLPEDCYTPPLVPAGVGPGKVSPPHLLEWFRADESMTPCTCTAVVRTEVARRLGGFVESFRGLFDDQVFYAKLALSESVWVNFDCLARYRKHAASICAVADTARERAAFEAWLTEYRGVC